MKRKVSIIVPTYNGEKYIKKCVESIMNQTYSNIEIIIVNDGSTDSTKKIIEELKRKDNRIKLYSNKNKGVSFSRNFGIDKSTGEYIFFVDSDDHIKPNTIEIMMDIIKKYDCDVVRCNYMVEKEDGTIINNNIEDKYIYSKDDKEELIKQIVFGKIPSFSCLLLIKKEKIIKKFDESIPYMEDLIFVLELLR